MWGAVIERMPSREKLALGLGLGGIIVLSWVYTYWLAVDMRTVGAHHHHHGEASQLGALFLMWAVMMMAMMLPSALPMVTMYGRLHQGRWPDRSAALPVWLFVLGYVLAWTVFSGAASILQLWLERVALVTPPMGILESHAAAGIVLVLAGTFQLSPLKNACLTQCRTPLSFLMTAWREGRAGAVTMGLHHGLFCIGCCWALMALLFVAGVMNLLWMGAITVYMALEKIAPGGKAIARWGGVALVVAGLLLLYRG
ncbi:MAG TPA: DUF2182 domain-containing protein [Candidatus Methylomirabilis sp.]|nr:DUF2182 domain-containing protein [Candidatus Methylomirabilis sp.]